MTQIASLTAGSEHIGNLSPPIVTFPQQIKIHLKPRLAYIPLKPESRNRLAKLRHEWKPTPTEPKQRPHQNLEQKHRSYWLGGVFVNQGLAWTTTLIEIEPVEDKRRWEAIPFCLGIEDDVVPIIKGKKPVPKNMAARRRNILLEVMQDFTPRNLRRNRPDDGIKRFTFSKRVSRSFRG